jgi:hypothetical protein
MLSLQLENSNSMMITINPDTNQIESLLHADQFFQLLGTQNKNIEKSQMMTLLKSSFQLECDICISSPPVAMGIDISLSSLVSDNWARIIDTILKNPKYFSKPVAIGWIQMRNVQARFKASAMLEDEANRLVIFIQYDNESIIHVQRCQTNLNINKDYPVIENTKFSIVSLISHDIKNAAICLQSYIKETYDSLIDGSNYKSKEVENLSNSTNLINYIRVLLDDLKDFDLSVKKIPATKLYNCNICIGIN